MQSDNPRISDITRMFTAAAGTFAGMGREASDAARERFKEAMGGLDFVSREEFEAVKQMAAAARVQNDALAARIAKLEAKHSGDTGEADHPADNGSAPSQPDDYTGL